MVVERQIGAARLWLVMMKAHSSIATYVEQTIAAQNLCLSDFIVLEVLLHKGPLTMSVIAEKVSLANASMTSSIDRLEEREFVQRVESSTDRRSRIVDLTPTGRRFINGIFSQHVEDLERITSVLTPSEQDTLYRLLKKVGLTAKDEVQRVKRNLSHKAV